MPEYMVNLVIGGFVTWLYRRVDAVESRLRTAETENAEVKAHKEYIEKNFARLEAYLQRVEEKLDAHVSENRDKIRFIKDKYHLTQSNDND